jgi:hypothetical protein
MGGGVLRPPSRAAARLKVVPTTKIVPTTMSRFNRALISAPAPLEECQSPGTGWLWAYCGCGFVGPGVGAPNCSPVLTAAKPTLDTTMQNISIAAIAFMLLSHNACGRAARLDDIPSVQQDCPA